LTAKRAYRFELGEDTTSFVQFGYWDSLRKGLSAGERLSQDLKRMEAAYLDRNQHKFEITKHVSLRQLDPYVRVKQIHNLADSLPKFVISSFRGLA
jgi:hypothetical protein